MFQISKKQKNSDPIIISTMNHLHFSNSVPISSSKTTGSNRRLTDAEYFSMLPSDYKFRPRDEELILPYLMKKVYNQPLPRNRINDEAHVYKYHPEELTSEPGIIPIIDGETKVWYFFCQRNKKYANGTRPDRKAGNGVWKPTSMKKRITEKGKKIEFRGTLVYHIGKHNNYIKTSWIMHEYTLHNYPPPVPTPVNNMTLDEWVLCRIYKNEKSEKSETIKKNNKEEPKEDIVVNEVMNNDISSIGIQDFESPDIQFKDIENWNMGMESHYPNNQLMFNEDEEFLNDPILSCFNPPPFNMAPVMCPFDQPAGNHITGNMLMQNSFQMQLPAANSITSQVGFQSNQQTQMMPYFQEQQETFELKEQR